MTWRNVQSDCMLCEMDKLTKWYLETDDWVVAEKLNGGPFVVSKTHQTKLSEQEWEEMESVVSQLFNEFDIRVIMNLVEDHWHGHIITGDGVDLSNE